MRFPAIHLGSPSDRWTVLGNGLRTGDVVFVVQAAYHLDDTLAVANELERRGRRVSIAAPAEPTDPLRRLRSSYSRYRELTAAAARHGYVPGPTLAEREVAVAAAAVVVRNDWGPSRSLVNTARRLKRPTIGWVEGVQDFDDVDTGRPRDVYRSVDHVLCLGEYDRMRLIDLDPVVVGTERLWQRWQGPTTTAEIPLVANVNFTYGVHEQVRRRWTAHVRQAAKSSGVQVIWSHHPASRPRLPIQRGTRTSIHALLPRTQRLVTRFSTLCYEALILGVDVVYYNPHGEQVPTFQDPMGAFAVARTPDELTRQLRRRPPAPREVRERARPFLHQHLSLALPRPATLAADVIARIVWRSRGHVVTTPAPVLGPVGPVARPAAGPSAGLRRAGSPASATDSAPARP